MTVETRCIFTIKKQNPEVCYAGTTRYYVAKIKHFNYSCRYFIEKTF
jgi:hypothetical protein